MVSYEQPETLRPGPTKRRQVIFDTLDDLVSSFLFYDRKEDEELPVGEIQRAYHAGEITPDELVAFFRERLLEGLR